MGLDDGVGRGGWGGGVELETDLDKVYQRVALDCEVREKGVTSYNIFNNHFGPFGKGRKIYYPCCAIDVTPSHVFHQANMYYCDLHKDSVDSLKAAGYNAEYGDAIGYLPESVESYDVVCIENPSVNGVKLASNLKSGGYVICNNYHSTAEQLTNSDEYELVAIISTDGELIQEDMLGYMEYDLGVLNYIPFIEDAVINIMKKTRPWAMPDRKKTGAQNYIFQKK